MRRKLVKQGRNALTVTLPAAWIKKHNLKAGHEVNVIEKDRNIMIGGEGEAETNKVSIDVTNINERTLRWLLSGLHKGGCDEIEVIFNEKWVLEVINDLMKNLFIGFAIVEQTDKRCILKGISKELETEINTILKRAFLVTVSMGESCIEMLKKGKIKDMKDLIVLENTNNQLTNFCERILNKKGYTEYNKTCFMYVISWNLEKVCDYYKYICEYLSGKKEIKIGNDVIEIFQMANNQIRGYSALLSKFKIEDLVGLNKEKGVIVDKIKDLLKNKGSDEIMVLSHLMHLVISCEDFSTSMFMLNYK